MRVIYQLLTSRGDCPTLRSNSAVFSMTRTRALGRFRLSMSAVAAPENAPPMITTSYSNSIATEKMDFAARKRNQIRQATVYLASNFLADFADSTEARPTINDFSKCSLDFLGWNS